MIKATRIGVLRRKLLEEPRRRSIIPGVLPVGTAFFYGSSGIGKTGLVIRTAVAIAAGLDWGGREVAKGSVLYVAGEDYQGVVDRMSAAIEFLGMNPDDMPISVMPCPDKGLVDGGARIEVANAAKALAGETGLALSLITFDTLSTCFGDENQDDATAAGKFLKNAERLSQDFECAVLTVHHSGKVSGKGMRGSSVFQANSDARAVLKRERGPTIVTVEKLRNERDGSRFAFDIVGTNLDVSGGSVSVQVVKSLNEWTPMEPTTKAEDAERREFTDAAVALTLLQGIAVDGKASIRAWQKDCNLQWQSKPSDGARRTAFANAKKTLIAKGKISVVDDFVSVSASENSANITANNLPPEPVSVSVSTTPSIRGCVTHADSGKVHSQKQIYKGQEDAVLADEGSPADGSIAKANAFVRRGLGMQSPEGAIAPALTPTC